MTDYEIKMNLRQILMTTTEDNVEQNVEFLFNLLVQQGVTV